MIREIHLKNFRNYDEEKVSFNGGINLFCGKNGQGKTNLLEAVYFLGMLASFRGAEASQLIKKGEPSFSLTGFFAGDDISKLYVEKGQRGWKSISADGGEYRKKTDYIGKVRMVVFSPDEIELIQGSPEGRRKYLDRTFFNIRHSHLKWLKKFKRVLRQRNILLKRGNFSGRELDTWSERLAHAGARVAGGRIELVDMLNEQLKEKRPFMGTARVSLEYVGCSGDNEDHEKIGLAILDNLAKVREEEKRRRVTLAGPHRDDLMISINGVAAKSFSSRGEMRSILLALKTAETEIYRSVWEANPLILLDDVASELDIERRNNLIDYLRNKEAQVMITTTEAENIPLLNSEKDGIFRVEQGRILH